MITINHPPNAILVKPPTREQRFVVISRGVINETNYVYIRPCIARRPVIRLRLKHALGTIMYGLNKVTNHNVFMEEKRYGLIWRAFVDGHPLGIAYNLEVFGIPCDLSGVNADLVPGSNFETDLFSKVCILPNVSDDTIALVRARGYCFITPCEFIHPSTQEFFGFENVWYLVDELQRRAHSSGPVTQYNLHGFIADPFRYQFVDNNNPDEPTKFRDTHPRIYGLCTHNDERLTTYLGSTDCAKSVRARPNIKGRWYSFNVNPPISICVSIREAKQPVLPTKVLKNGLVAVRATVPAPAWVRFNGYLTLTCRHPLLFRVVFPNDCAFYQEYADVVMVYADHSLLGISFYVVAVHNGIDMAWLDNRDEFYRHLAFASDFSELRTRYSIEKDLLQLSNYLDDASCLIEEEAHVTIPTQTKSGEWKVEHGIWRSGYLEPFPKKVIVERAKYYPGDPWADFEKYDGVIPGVSGPQPTLEKPIVRGDGKSAVKIILPSVSAPSPQKDKLPIIYNNNNKKAFNGYGSPLAGVRPVSRKPAPSNFVLTGQPAPIVIGLPPRQTTFRYNKYESSNHQNRKFDKSGGSRPSRIPKSNSPPVDDKYRGNGGTVLIGGGRPRPLPPMTPIPEESISMLSSRTQSVLSFNFDE